MAHPNLMLKHALKPNQPHGPVITQGRSRLQQHSKSNLKQRALLQLFER